ncbi:MAG TPA: lipoyl(octanoyl) transferase LipB [Acidobacteriota bacterium]|nr:lipoyl(octanoyl) transferase LipB [Acidobacteriota bacterium]
MNMRFIDLGLISFEAALVKQEETVAAVAGDSLEETIFLLEHPHVFTCGRGGNEGNLLASVDWNENPIELIRINRGGDVTYHGPGQLVGYPHLDLRKRNRDVHRYLRDLETVLIATAERFGVHAFRREGLTGVWTDAGKLASIGVGVRRWVTMHGFALNVSTDLRYFQLINPCGMPNCPVVSLSSLTGCPVEMSVVKRVFEEEFRKTFCGVLNQAL